MFQVNIDSGYKNSKGFYLDYYKTNSEWDIDNTSWHIYRDKQDAAINFKITLKRKPMYFMMSILLPICMLSILNICVFVIPVNSGEKASYAVTVFLSFAVFLTIISDTFPKNSESIPLFTTFLVMQTTVSAITTILALVLSRLESFGDAKVPGLLVKLMKMRSCRPRRSRGNRTSCRPCLSRGNKSKVHVIEPTEDAENSTDSLKNDHTVKVEWKDAVNFLDFVFFVLFSVMLIVSIITFLYFAASKGKVYNEEFNYTSNGQYEQHDNSGHGSGNDGGLDSGQDSGHGSGHDDGGNNDQTDNYYNYYYYDRDDYHNNYY
ncbi:hypothetical protein DPMN_016981 [Dreissena polymorpha]|uniref:Neurotransmitter-gated ion-channel transmembrane domain-containing protein n=1 Tax=Dreissena polymorpha TaxID=45954 RepID=A0A9D4NAM4_DREPO|nr:hypothetical protein DPMN_016981 [Dreissena polymorpha]